ncbi:MAG: dihydrofolate reductase family protein, partial [Thermoplasmata archaeon]|nr:dihydrofolate reductase family protein [Thermoplasmata archaeon]
EGAGMLECGKEQVDLNHLLSHLWKRGIKKVMVEGGGTLIASFLKEGLVDIFMIFIGDMVIGGKEAPTSVMGQGAGDFEDIVRLERYAVIPMEKGVRIHYRVKRG